jgi:hypothetical protein
MELHAAVSPLLLDWSFWAAFVAALALILSQLPPLKILIRPTRLRVEPYDRLVVTHWLGNPNINLYLALTNTGGRQVRVLALKLTMQPEGGSEFVMPGQSFAAPASPQASFLLTRFTLTPDETWGNLVTFYTSLDTTDERTSKQLVKDLRMDINQKLTLRQQVAPQSQGLVEADPTRVEPLRKFFEQHNRWRAGEYTARLTIDCEPQRASVVKNFRFTLFESDIQELAEAASKYKYGAGVYYADAEATLVNPRIRPLA